MCERLHVLYIDVNTDHPDTTQPNELLILIWKHRYSNQCNKFLAMVNHFFLK